MSPTQQRINAGYHWLFQHSPTPIAIINVEGMLLECNQAYSKLLAHTEIAQHVFNTTSPEQQPDGQRSSEIAKKALCIAKEKGAHQFEWSYYNAHAHEFSATVSLNTMPFAGKNALCLMININTRQQQQANLARALEQSTDIIYAYNMDGIITSANATSKKLFGSELVGRHITDIIAPDHLELALAMTQKKLEGGADTSYELDIINQHGKRLHLEINSSLLLHDGKPVGIHGIARDITQRKQAESKLQLLIKAIHASHEAIMVTDTKGIIDFSNPAAATLYHQPLDTMVGMHITHLCGRSDGDAIATVNHGNTWSGEIKPEHDGLKGKVIDRHISPISNDNNQVDHHIYIDRDITKARAHSAP